MLFRAMPPYQTWLSSTDLVTLKLDTALEFAFDTNEFLQHSYSNGTRTGGLRTDRRTYI